MARVGRGPNTGLFFTETTPLPASWAEAAGQLHRAVHPSAWQASACPTLPGPVIPVPCDPDWYCRSHPTPAEARGLPPGVFRFYTVADTSARKNLVGLLRAYFHAFRAGDGVELVVKATGPGVAGLVGETIGRAKLSTHPPVRVIDRRLSDGEMAGLAQACDCYATASRGEGWGLDAADAAFFGKTPVAADWGAFPDYAREAGYLVPAAPEPCFDGGGVHHQLFTGRRTWAAPVLTELAAAMRAAAGDQAGRARRADAGLALADQFSYEAVGPRLREFVCRATDT